MNHFHSSAKAAKTNDNGNSSARILKEKAKLGKLLASMEGQLWKVGDQLVLLIDDLGLSLKKLASEFRQQKYSRLSEIYSTAKAFPEGERDFSHPFYHHEIAREGENRVAREMRLRLGKDVRPNYSRALKEVTRGKTPQGKPIRTKREGTKYLASLRRKEVEADLVAAPEMNLSERCYNTKAEEYLVTVADFSAKIIGMDVPYGQYTKLRDGRLDASTSAAEIGGDNLIEVEAVETTCASLRAAATKLDKGGVILLWQAANFLRIPILDAIGAAGLEIENVVVWDKGRPQLEDPTTPYTNRLEFLWVLKRKGNHLVNHNDSPTDNLLSFAPVQMNAASLFQPHIFEKPIELMAFLVGKHSNKGDLVLDLFGCTGSLSIAAHKGGRDFRYVESHPDNFQIGLKRLQRAMTEKGEPTPNVNKNSKPQKGIPPMVANPDAITAAVAMGVGGKDALALYSTSCAFSPTLTTKERIADMLRLRTQK